MALKVKSDFFHSLFFLYLFFNADEVFQCETALNLVPGFWYTIQF